MTISFMNFNFLTDYGLGSSSTDPNIVAISSPTQVTGTIVTVPTTSVQTITPTPTTTYITYPQLRTSIGSNTVKVVKNNGNSIIIAPQTDSIMLHTPPQRREKRTSQVSTTQLITQPMVQITPTQQSAITAASVHASPQNQHISVDETELKRSILQMQKEEMEYRVREAKLKCELQEMEKLKAREELIQLREIHQMKIKEMELRLRNIERT